MSARLTVTVLVENGPTCHDDLVCEHGLSLHLAYGSLRLLLDFGQSDAFARNAKALGIDLAQVDLAVLSHAHYDHADGMPAFFAANDHAPLYLSEACDETCWSSKGGSTKPHYIGIGRGLLERHASRLSPVSTIRMTTLVPGVHVVPHTTPGLSLLGERAGMFQGTEEALVPDDYAHEVSLVLELGENRLAVFNSCSHAGLSAIAREVLAAFPGARIDTFVGGLHLVHSTNKEILQVAEAIQAAGIEHVWTGHCTGPHALRLLSRSLPGRVNALRPGLTF